MSGFELPPIPNCLLPLAAMGVLDVVASYGQACAKAGRAPLLARIEELEGQLRAADVVSESALNAAVELRAENEALRAAVRLEFVNFGDSEDQFKDYNERLNCPSCGGSGHIDDVVSCTDTERLDWLLRKLPGSALRYCVGELSDTSDVAEFRVAIDAARAAQPEQQA